MTVPSRSFYILRHKNPNVHAVFENSTLNVCARVQCAPAGHITNVVHFCRKRGVPQDPKYPHKTPKNPHKKPKYLQNVYIHTNTHIRLTLGKGTLYTCKISRSKSQEQRGHRHIYIYIFIHLLEPAGICIHTSNKLSIGDVGLCMRFVPLHHD